MGDTRIGEHALDVGLHDRDEIPQARVARQIIVKRTDQSARPSQAFHKHAQEGAEAGGFEATAMKAVTEVGAPW